MTPPGHVPVEGQEEDARYGEGEPAGTVTPPPRRPRLGRSLRRTLILVLILAVACIATLRWVVVPYRIVGDSMAPTLQGAGPGGGGDVVLVLRPAYWVRPLQRWDVVVVQREGERGRTEREGEPHVSVKRIAGLPGETVEIREGAVWVGGSRVQPPASIAGTYVVRKGPHGHGPVTLGMDECFVLGDNSYLSSDSRSWGPVRREQLRGRAFLVVMPVSRFGILR